MMRPMKMAGDQLMFGEGCLAHLETLCGKKAIIVTSGKVMEQNGVMDIVKKHLNNANIESIVFDDVEPDPSFSTVMRGADAMKEYQPDIIIALGGGSPMDAAKGMWVFYEHPNLTKLEEILPPNKIPKLRNKAYMVCIPSTAGTASEVSRSIVITDDETHTKHGIGDMEMMPDIAICDPIVTASMPPKITAETGMDALTHAVEAIGSNRANFLSDILAKSAIVDIMKYLKIAYDNGSDMQAREKMLNASTTAGIAFTNVSLGIVHSMAHTLGSIYSIPHGLANAILLPHIMKYNEKAEYAKAKYDDLAELCGVSDFTAAVKDLNKAIGIPSSLSEIIPDEEDFMNNLDKMAKMAKEDGCTKTNPVIPSEEEIKELYKLIYKG